METVVVLCWSKNLDKDSKRREKRGMERGTELWSGNKAKNPLSCPTFSHQPNSKKS